MRRVTVRAVVRYRLMLPQEGAALLCMARRTRLIDRLLDKELRAVGTVHIVTAGAADLAFQHGMP